MGCDIHVYVEKLNPETKEWEFQDAPSIELYRRHDTDEPVMANYWYWGRNYDLFAVLANVRNSRGFAGVYTGEQLQYLEEPRGIPEDASERYKQIAGPYTGRDCAPCQTGEGECPVDGEHGWGEDGHSHSWFTLRELATTTLYDQEQIKGGVVGPKQYLEWRDQGSPSTWSGGISGAGIEIVEPPEMERRLAADPGLADAAWPAARTYTHVRWKTVLRDSLGSDWFDFLAKLGRMTLDDGSDVRAVFFFDN